MPTSKYSDQCPPFPSVIPTATLFTISLARLRALEDAESDNLFHLCRHQVFFLLGLRDADPGQALISDAEAVSDPTAETLNLDQAHADKVKVVSANGGYKGHKAAAS